MKKKALLIAIEGSDGAGKATQTNLLYSYFKKQTFQGKKLKVARVSFPRYNQTLGGTLLYEVLKSERADSYGFSKIDPRVASKLYAMDREESLPYLESLIARNDIVIFDRYVKSNLLHQGGKFSTNKDRLEFAEWLFRFEYGNIGLPQPDTIMYLALLFLFLYDVLNCEHRLLVQHLMLLRKIRSMCDKDIMLVFSMLVILGGTWLTGFLVEKSLQKLKFTTLFLKLSDLGIKKNFSKDDFLVIVLKSGLRSEPDFSFYSPLNKVV